MPPPTTAIIPSLPSFLFCAKNDDGDKFSIKNKNKKATNIPVELMNELFLAVSDDKLSSRDEGTITSWYYSYSKQAKIKPVHYNITCVFDKSHFTRLQN